MMGQTEIEKLQEEERRAYADLLKAREELKNAETRVRYAQDRHTKADAALIAAEARRDMGRSK